MSGPYDLNDAKLTETGLPRYEPPEQTSKRGPYEPRGLVGRISPQQRRIRGPYEIGYAPINVSLARAIACGR